MAVPLTPYGMIDPAQAQATSQANNAAAEQRSLAPPDDPTQIFDIPGTEVPVQDEKEQAKAHLAELSNEIAIAGIEGNTEGLRSSALAAINRLFYSRLPPTPKELGDLGMIVGADGMPRPVEEYTREAGLSAAMMTEKITKRIDDYLANEGPKLREAEERARMDFEDAATEARYGMPADNVKQLKAMVAQASQNPEDFGAQQSARQALAKLQKAEQDVVDPKAYNVWSNKSPFQAAMFIALNAIAGAAQAYGYKGQTPLDVTDRMMEQDIERQKEIARRRDVRSASARTAYEVAARRTDNETQRMLIAKDLMWAPIQAEAEAAGLLQASAAIKDKRAEFRHNAEVNRFTNSRSQDAAALGPAISLILSGDRQKAIGGSWRGKTHLLDKTLQKISSVHTLNKFQELWEGSQQAAVGWLLGKVPGAWTDANVYERFRRRLSILIAASENQGRPTDRDADAVYASLPGAGVIGEGGKEMFKYQIDRAIESARLYLAGTRVAVGDEAVDYLLQKIDPEVVKGLEYNVPRNPGSGFQEGPVE